MTEGARPAASTSPPDVPVRDWPLEFGYRKMAPAAADNAVWIISAAVMGGFIGVGVGLVYAHVSAAITVSVLAVLLPLWFFWGSIENHRLLCYPHGFTLEVRNRGVCLRRDEYRWEDVTETVCRGGDEPVDESATLVWFSVRARGREAFSVNQNTPRFDELVQVVNAMTVHLDYVWKQPGGISGDRYFSYPRSGGEIGQGAPPAGDAAISITPAGA